MRQALDGTSIVDGVKYKWYLRCGRELNELSYGARKLFPQMPVTPQVGTCAQTTELGGKGLSFWLRPSAAESALEQGSRTKER